MLRYDFYGKDIYHDRRLVSKGEKFGFINEAGKEVIPCVYDFAHGFYYGNSMVVIDNKCGVIDVNGDIIVPLMYSNMFQVTQNLFIVKLNDKYTVIDSEGNKLFDDFFDDIRSDFYGNLVVQKDGKYGVMSRAGELSLPVIYDKIGKVEMLLWKVTLNGKTGIVNSENEIIVEPIYDSINPICHNLFNVCVNRSQGLLSFEGKTLIEPIYDFIDSITNDIFVVKNHDGKLGVVDKTGKVIIPIQYDAIDEYFNAKKGFQTYIVMLNGKYGLLDKNNNIIIDIIYDDIDYYFGPNLDVLKFKQGDMYGLISVTGEFFVEPKYNTISCFDDDSATAIVQIGNKKGCLDGNGTEIIPVEFDNIQILSTGYIKVEKDKKCGLCSWTGEKITDVIYDDIFIHGRGLGISVILKDMEGYLDLE